MIIVAASILVYGRAFEILVYEWDYDKAHLSQLLSYRRGGIASHGVLLGSAVGMWLISRARRRGFVAVADEVVIPAAFFFAIGSHRQVHKWRDRGHCHGPSRGR